MDKKCETMVFNLANYDNNYNDMFKDLGGMLHILTKNHYDCRFYYEDCGIYVLEYNTMAHRGLGNPTLHWLTTEEEESLDVINNYNEEPKIGSYNPCEDCDRNGKCEVEDCDNSICFGYGICNHSERP